MVVFIVLVIFAIVGSFLISKIRDKYTNKEKEEEVQPLQESDVFNVEAFNNWFNDPNNGATYANAGIFLRLDKLSEIHIKEYMEKVHGIENFGPFLWSQPTHIMVTNFMEAIKKDWKIKL